MTTVDRLAAIIAEHRLQGGLDRYRCTCGAATAKGLSARAWRERHLAAVIASADDLAVIEPPKPDGDYWQAGPFEVTTSAGGEVIVDHEYWLSPGDATAGCAGILAAVKAAEGVEP